MPLNSHALTEFTVVRDTLGLAGDAAQGRTERIINAASEAIETFCGRHFEYAEEIVEFVRGMENTPRIVLNRTPITSIAAIEVIGHDGTIVDTLVETTYRIEDARAGLVFRVLGWPWAPMFAGDASGTPLADTEAPNLRVTYAGGYITPAQAAAGLGARDLPADIEEACIITAVSFMRQDGQDQRIDMGSVGEGPTSSRQFVDGTAAAIPKAALALVDKYRRRF